MCVWFAGISMHVHMRMYVVHVYMCVLCAFVCVCACTCVRVFVCMCTTCHNLVSVLVCDFLCMYVHVRIRPCAYITMCSL